MSDNLDGILNEFKNIINTDEGSKLINSLLNSFDSENRQDNKLSNGDNLLDSIDANEIFGMIQKFSPLLSNDKNNKNVDLIKAISPFLNNKRQEKVQMLTQVLKWGPLLLEGINKDNDSFKS